MICNPGAQVVERFQSYKIHIFTQLKLRLATATHNFKWEKMTDISRFKSKTSEDMPSTYLSFKCSGFKKTNKEAESDYKT